MILACFVQSSVFRVQAIAADHVTPAQCMIIITSCIRPTYVSIVSRKIAVCHALFSFLLFYLTCANVLNLGKSVPER